MRATLYSAMQRINTCLFNCTDAVIKTSRECGDLQNTHTDIIMRDYEWDTVHHTEFIYYTEYEFTLDECDSYYELTATKDTGDFIDIINIYGENDERFIDNIYAELGDDVGIQTEHIFDTEKSFDDVRMGEWVVSARIVEL